MSFPRTTVLALGLVLSSSAFAWGPEGHEVVAEIAEDHLLPGTRATALKILGNVSFASVATWADEVKFQEEWKKTKSWHFLNVPDGKTLEQTTRDPQGDVVSAITQMVTTLKNPKATPLDKQNALKFIIHFVGDIHQPLHVGRAEDMGGNSIKVQFDGHDTNLHALWDSGMITQENIPPATLATRIQSTAKASYDLPEFSFSQIISEDMLLRKQVYGFGQGSISDGYVKLNLPALHKQLLNGGLRLANLLNQILK